jgi:hypothetical protein
VRADPSAQPRSTDVRLRGALLMPLCALAVHQGRYYLAFGSHAGARLAREGHAYLMTIEPFVLLAVALALGGFVGRLARAWQSPSPTVSRSHGVGRVWAACALVLLALYCGQELFEGWFAVGHPAGVAGIVGHGGWIAVPLAGLIGAVLAATLRVAHTLIELAARGGRRARARPRASVALRLMARTAADWRLEPQSGLVAGRAPPLPL